ncbi:hypothetical protein [Streptomyces sp. NPDC019937]|uniref:hypothetical protein n=1 Tax=Streptomyces sp. NPDC019937 TaxID=3154787 RepID=UPI0034090B82
MTWYLSAPAAVQGITNGQLLGPITLSGGALASTIVLGLGVRGSDRIKIDSKEKAGWTGIVTGTLYMAAGGAWADIGSGAGSIPTSVLGSDSGLGDPGLGGIALCLTLLTFGPRWKRKIWPALLGISDAVVYGQAAGVWGILINIIRMAVGHVTGGA